VYVYNVGTCPSSMTPTSRNSQHRCNTNHSPFCPCVSHETLPNICYVVCSARVSSLRYGGPKSVGRPTIVRTFGHLKADLRPADGHRIAPAATLGNCGLGRAQDPDVDGVVQSLQTLINMGQQSCIPLQGQATDNRPGELLHNILQTVKQESTLGS
jgi:hypothetical protein